MSKFWYKCPFASGTNIGDAWFEGFDMLLQGELSNNYLTVHIDDPIADMNLITDSTDLEEWEEILNLGDLYEPYCRFDFGAASKNGGKTGRAWIESRIYELYEGLYHNRLQQPNQIEMIRDRLMEGNHGACTNALVAQVFDTADDLEVATSGRPFAKDMACLTQIQFRPKKSRLHLFAKFWSQYLDSKAYGNLISLAMLLGQMCKETGYRLGIIVEHVSNTICYSNTAAHELQERMYEWRADRKYDGYDVVVNAVDELGLGESYEESGRALYGAFLVNEIPSNQPIRALAAACINILRKGQDIDVTIHDIAEVCDTTTTSIIRATNLMEDEMVEYEDF